jgi:hypothetical protein
MTNVDTAVDEAIESLIEAITLIDKAEEGAYQEGVNPETKEINWPEMYQVNSELFPIRQRLIAIKAQLEQVVPESIRRVLEADRAYEHNIGD